MGNEVVIAVDPDGGLRGEIVGRGAVVCTAEGLAVVNGRGQLRAEVRSSLNLGPAGAIGSSSVTIQPQAAYAIPWQYAVENVAGIWDPATPTRLRLVQAGFWLVVAQWWGQIGTNADVESCLVVTAGATVTREACDQMIQTPVKPGWGFNPAALLRVTDPGTYVEAGYFNARTVGTSTAFTLPGPNAEEMSASAQWLGPL